MGHAPQGGEEKTFRNSARGGVYEPRKQVQFLQIIVLFVAQNVFAVSGGHEIFSISIGGLAKNN